MKLALGVAVAAVSISVGTAALAQTDPGVRNHDGFHFSIGLGAAYGVISGTEDPEPPGGGELSISGPGVAGQLLFGGTPAPGLVIGGGSQGAHFFSPTVEFDGTEVDWDGDVSANLLGPYVQYYFNPNQGLYLQAMLGIATLDDGNDDSEGLAAGLGVGVGLGNEWWIGEQWAIGVLARCHLLAVGQELERGTETVDVGYGALVPAVLVNLTYH